MTPDPTLTDEELAEMVRRFPYLEVARLIAALRASRKREREAARGYPDDLATVPPNERAKMLLANVRARGDEYGDVANSFGDLLRDALVLAAGELNESDAALRASRAEVERLRQCVEWARWHITEEWPNGPTGDGENWAMFIAVADNKESDPPSLWWVAS